MEWAIMDNSTTTIGFLALIIAGIWYAKYRAAKREAKLEPRPNSFAATYPLVMAEMIKRGVSINDSIHADNGIKAHNEIRESIGMEPISMHAVFDVTNMQLEMALRARDIKADTTVSGMDNSPY